MVQNIQLWVAVKVGTIKELLTGYTRKEGGDEEVEVDLYFMSQDSAVLFLTEHLMEESYIPQWTNRVLGDKREAVLTRLDSSGNWVLTTLESSNELPLVAVVYELEFRLRKIWSETRLLWAKLKVRCF